MSNNPTNSADLGSAFATVGYVYKPDGMQQFIAGARRGEQAIARLTQAQQTPLNFQSAIGQLHQAQQSLQQIGTSAERVRAILNQRGALGLTEQAQQSREALDRLEHKAESLRAKIASIGIDPAKLRNLLDAEGRVRETVQVRAGDASFAEQQRRILQRDFGRVASPTAADSRFESLLKGAEPGTRLADADDINAAKALVEETARYADELKRVEAQQRALERSSTPDRQSRSIEAATAALREYEQAIERATTAQRQRAQAEQRIAQLEGRTTRLNQAATADPESRASYLAVQAAEQLRVAKERQAAATQTVTQATQQQAAAEARLLAIEERLTGVRQPTTQIRVQDVSDRTLQLETERQRTAELGRQSAELLKQGQLEQAGAQRLSAVASKEANIAAAQQTAAARIGAATQRTEQVRIQTAARVESAEKQAAARIQQAHLAAHARVEAARIQSASRLEAQEKRIAAQQERAARSSQFPLPRTFAGFTGGGIVQALGAAGIVTSLDQVIGKARELAEESTTLAKRAETIAPAYEDAAAKAGVASDELLRKLKDASRGTISETNLQIGANRALITEIVADSQQLADLLTIARERGKRLGVDTQEAFRRIVEGIGKNETELLDELGILPNSQRAYKAYADSIGISADQLTKQQKALALTNDILASNRDLLKESGQAALDNADLQAQAAVRREEALARLGKSLIPAQTALAGTTADIFDLLSGQSGEKRQELDDQLLQSSDSFEQYGARVNAVNQAIAASIGTISKQMFGLDIIPDVLSDVLPAVVREEFELRKEIEAADGALLNYEGELRKAAAAHKEHADAATVDADAQKAFTDAVADAGRANTDALERRADALVDAEERYQDRVADLNERAVEATQETQESINETIADGARERAEIVGDNAEQLVEIEQNYQEQVQDAQEQYAERRADLIKNYQRRESDEAERFREEQAQAERDATTSLLQSRANFFDRLFEMTNRRGGGGKRAQEGARRAREQAIAEASAAGLDAQGRAEYIRAREEQILDKLERDRANAQKVRDSQRGGQLSREQAQQQVQESAGYQKEAEQATLDAIKEASADRQRQRDQEQARRREDFEEQLGDLDENHADQLAKLKESHDEQLAETQRANAERLQEFDRRQRERIQQIEEHGREQQASIQKHLDEEKIEVAKARAEIEEEYQESLNRIRDDLNERAQEIFYPEETQRRQLEEAYRTLGDQLGYAFVEQLKARITGSTMPGDADLGVGGTAATAPTGGTSGPRTRNRGSRVGVKTDPILSDQAIDTLVAGGTQTDGFSSARESTGTHQGVDIAAKEGTPIKSPIDGTVQYLADHPVFGKRVIVSGPNGEYYFGHIRRASVPNGAQVRRGQQVAEVGKTGTHGIGAHLHLQYRPRAGAAPVDPTQTLENMVGAAPSSGGAGSGTSRAQSFTRPSRTFQPVQRPQMAVSGGPAQAINWDQEMRLDETLRQPIAPTSGAPNIQISNSIPLNFAGAVFSGGMSEADVRRVFEPMLDNAILNLDQTISQQLQNKMIQGPVRS